METRVYIHAPERTFIFPFIREVASDFTLVDSPEEADTAIMLSSVDIYGPSEGLMMAENEDIDTASPWHIAEEEFLRQCAVSGVKTAILRCADIIGTGMTGRPRRWVEGIWRGTLLHIKDNNACVSVVHATDVAQAVKLVVEKDITGIFNITDGTEPRFDDVLEALAYRLSNKRISTLSTRGQLWLGRLIYGRTRWQSYTTSRTFDCSAFTALSGYSPVPVIEYLRTHNYEE